MRRLKLRASSHYSLRVGTLAYYVLRIAAYRSTIFIRESSPRVTRIHSIVHSRRNDTDTDTDTGQDRFSKKKNALQ